jgi:hypothetical protein
MNNRQAQLSACMLGLFFDGKPQNLKISAICNPGTQLGTGTPCLRSKLGQLGKSRTGRSSVEVHCPASEFVSTG